MGRQPLTAHEAKTTITIKSYLPFIKESERVREHRLQHWDEDVLGPCVCVCFAWKTMTKRMHVLILEMLCFMKANTVSSGGKKGCLPVNKNMSSEYFPNVPIKFQMLFLNVLLMLIFFLNGKITFYIIILQTLGLGLGFIIHFTFLHYIHVIVMVHSLPVNQLLGIDLKIQFLYFKNCILNCHKSWMFWSIDLSLVRSMLQKK